MEWSILKVVSGYPCTKYQVQAFAESFADVEADHMLDRLLA